MIARLVALAAILLSTFYAPLAMANPRPEPVAHAASDMNGMGDCPAPAKQQPCQVDCVLCHALAPATADLQVVTVTYSHYAAAAPIVWKARTVEVEPPVPRPVS